MNQQHQPVMSPVPPAIPYQNGRPGHNNVPYPQQPYPYYHYPPPYGYPQQFHPMHRPPPQWQPYPMQMQMNRSQHPYPPPMNHYPPQQYQQMRPVPHHHPSSASLHSNHGLLSPSPSHQSHQSQFAPPSAPPPQAPPTAQVAQAPQAPQVSQLPSAPSTPQSPQVPHTTPPPKASTPVQTPTPTRTSFEPPLPWQTFEGDFTGKRARRRRTPEIESINASVQLPPRPEVTETTIEEEADPSSTNTEIPNEAITSRPAAVETPATSNPPSEIMSTQPSTPTSSIPPHNSGTKAASASHTSVPSISIRPAIPNIPLPNRAVKKTTESIASGSTKPAISTTENDVSVKDEPAARDEAAAPVEAVPTKAAPKSWADLVRSKAPPRPIAPAATDSATDKSATANGVFTSKTSTLTDVLKSYKVTGDAETKTAFLEPRGLVNTGNMCYMNSVLQILLFCVPFYAFLEKVGKQAAHNFNSDTPMMDAMIMFMREFKIIDAATSIDQLRMRLKDNELEQYGEAFIPEFVYNVIRRLPRFSSMRRGHQQDAEEFLGFLLEELHDECARTLKGGQSKSVSGTTSPDDNLKSPTSEFSTSQRNEDGGWLEVGPKQRPSTTRSSGTIATESPITKIFGGNLRSELRVPGMKNSVTLEPYQPLQLDIGSPHVHNIVDALKGLTKPETLHGQFNSPRGPGSTATKQVTIETLPEVLILHLKRFQYDNAGGTQKIWKKVGYPLDLEIPKEVFPQHKRGGLLAHSGLPKYRLIGVVYHHGKNASTGHYTVDVRRQEGMEWIRLDDTVIRRVRSEDVAAGGSEEDPKALAQALEQHKQDQATTGTTTANFYEGFAGGDDDETEEKPKVDKAWSQVAESGGAGGTHHAKKKSQHQLTNGNVTPRPNESGKMTPVARTAALKEGKVAYILFYQKIGV